MDTIAKVLAGTGVFFVVMWAVLAMVVRGMRASHRTPAEDPPGIASVARCQSDDGPEAVVRALWEGLRAADVEIGPIVTASSTATFEAQLEGTRFTVRATREAHELRVSARPRGAELSREGFQAWSRLLSQLGDGLEAMGTVRHLSWTAHPVSG